MFWLIFTAIYIISFVLHIAIIYLDCKEYLYRVGDIIDEIRFFMWCPVVNTIALIMMIIAFALGYLIELLNIEELWEKFRDIKIKK